MLLALWSQGFFLGNFWKLFLRLPFALFQKMRVLGDLSKIAITWPFGQPMLVRCTFRMTELLYTYGCPTLIEAYFYELFLRNHWVTLHLLVSSLKCSLWLLGLLIESLDHTTLLGAPPTVQLMFVSSSYTITGLHYTYGSATLSAAYVGYLYVENHRVTLQLLVRHLK